MDRKSDDPVFLRIRKAVDVLKNAPSGEQPALLWEGPGGMIQRLPTNPHCLVGRTAGQEAWLEDGDLSRDHFTVEGDHLTDLESTNGTFVNCRRVLKLQLEHGDIVMAGNQLMVFEHSQLK